MKKILLFSLLAGFFLPALFGQVRYEHSFQNPDLPIEERIENLLGLLDPEERVGLMMMNSRAVPRLGIPEYDWWNEALHGVARAGLATVFPQAIGMAATWNEPEHLKTFEIISDEARAKYNQFVREGKRGRYQGISFWTPNINIFRDPRWGRGQETYGEDPYLTTRLGIAAVKGLQGDHPVYYKTHACAKHFAVHSGPEWNRHSYNALVSGRDLWETYLPAFEALIREANVREVMCAYNAYDGQPCCGSDLLMLDILRNRWGYQGMVVSDCWAINDFFMENHHATHPTPAAAAADAVIHSTDLECGPVYENLTKALEEGLITQEQIDTSLRRVLRGWFELGMLDPADRVPWSNLPYSVVDSPDHREQAVKVARESMVLLKNDNETLPLNKNIKKIAILGPNAADSVMLWGNYNGIPSSTVTIAEGIRRKLPLAEIIYDKGCDLVDPWTRTSLYDNLKSAPQGEKGLDVRFYNNSTFSGEAAAAVINATGIHYSSHGGTALAPGVDRENTSTRISGLFTAPYTGEVVFSAHASDGYRLFIDGKEVLSRQGREATVPAEYAVNLEKGKDYQIALEHIQKGRNVSIGFDVFRKEKADFSNLMAKLNDVDAIIYVGGLSPSLEGEEMPVNAEGFKGGDKVSIDLPKIQREFLSELRKTGKPVVFVLCTGSALALEQDEHNYDALLCAWYGGQAAGTAVADVLFGDYNPAGRLPVTFYKTLEQLDNALSKHDDPQRQGFENYDMEGRTYRYMKETPLYAFGHGLSYSTFTYGDAGISSKEIKGNKEIAVTIPVTNSSTRDGDEVVQVYVRRNNDPEAPNKSLRAFRRIHLKAGETWPVELTITPEAFEFYDGNVDGLVMKPGSYTILYGGTSDEINQKQIEVKVK
ncbi:beta-glucosidase [Proteiniphilum saccharofermentans]|uniref:beta-glucosidase n=1 Tax=Proteiniphilum saccharofermentans TaxID=1642647 RepID=UPI0028B25BDF|nr:glycoside hydrolase family 3 C-terminal domain-containing protein [Proteiniphilum saccharofermentans]